MKQAQACNGRNTIGMIGFPTGGCGTGAAGSGWALAVKLTWVITISTVVEICDIYRYVERKI